MGKTYLVTGAAGGVGLAVLKLLRDLSPQDVTHVKALDLRLPPDMMDYFNRNSKGIEFEWICGDITDASFVLDVVKDCDVVLHLVGIIPGSPVDDHDTMQNVNVTGVRNVVNACCKCGVSRLVHISSVAVVGPNLKIEQACDLKEDSPYNLFPMTFYGQTKREGERIVLLANGHKSNEHERILRTCALRPPGIYGPNTPILENAFTMSRKYGSLPAMVSKECKQSAIYVGNLAWAILTAAKQLEEKASIAGGKAYFIRDDTPDQTYHSLYKNMFPAIGTSLGKREPMAPFWIAYLWYSILCLFLGFLRYFGLTSKNIPQREYLFTSNTFFTISGENFARDFDFKPRYSYETAIGSCITYLKRMKQEGCRRMYDIDY